MDISDIKLRINMNVKFMWYSCILNQLEVVESEEVLTAEVQGKTISINPNFLSTLTPEEAQGVLLHQLRHITDLTEVRLGQRDPLKWNSAHDHSINLDLLEWGVKLPKGVLADPIYKGLAAEEIYELLPDAPEEQEWCEGVSGQSEEDLIDIKNIVVQVTQQTKLHSSAQIPAHIERLVAKWVKPKLDYRTIFERYMTQKSQEDYSWKRPARRGLPQGLYLPSRDGVTLGKLHVFIDVSGSVSQELYALQLSQIKWIHENLNVAELKIINFDTRIRSEVTITPEDTFSYTCNGGGGTRVHEVVEYMQNNQAEVNVIFTDGYFNKVCLNKVQGDVLCCIYDQKGFTWDKATVMEISLDEDN